CAWRGPPLVGSSESGWWSAPVAAHGVVLLWLAEVRAVGGQPQSLRMAWSFLLVVGGVGWWSAPVAAHGVVLSPGGRRGGLVVSPSRCAWRGPFSWWSAGWVRGQPQSLRMAVPPLLLPCCGRIVTCDSEPATLTAGLALCDHVTSITYRP